MFKLSNLPVFIWFTRNTCCWVEIWMINSFCKVYCMIIHLRILILFFRWPHHSECRWFPGLYSKAAVGTHSNGWQDRVLKLGLDQAPAGSYPGNHWWCCQKRHKGLSCQTTCQGIHTLYFRDKIEYISWLSYKLNYNYQYYSGFYYRNTFIYNPLTTRKIEQKFNFKFWRNPQFWLIF